MAEVISYFNQATISPIIVTGWIIEIGITIQITRLAIDKLAFAHHTFQGYFRFWGGNIQKVNANGCSGGGGSGGGGSGACGCPDPCGGCVEVLCCC